MDETVIKELKQVRDSLTPGEWRDARIYRHIDEYKLDYTLIATKISSGQIHFYDLDSGEFQPLNLSRQWVPFRSKKPGTPTKSPGSCAGAFLFLRQYGQREYVGLVVSSGCLDSIGAAAAGLIVRPVERRNHGAGNHDAHHRQ